MTELTEATCTCLLCKEQQSVLSRNAPESRETIEEGEGVVNLAEKTIQADVEMVTEEHTDLLEATPGQTSAMGQAEATTNTETPMDLGNYYSGEI